MSRNDQPDRLRGRESPAKNRAGHPEKATVYRESDGLYWYLAPGAGLVTHHLDQVAVRVTEEYLYRAVGARVGLADDGDAAPCQLGMRRVSVLDEEREMHRVARVVAVLGVDDQMQFLPAKREPRPVEPEVGAGQERQSERFPVEQLRFREVAYMDGDMIQFAHP